MVAENSAILKIAKRRGLRYKSIIGAQRSYKRSKVLIKESDSEIEIRVTALDPGALKASINSVLKDIETIENSDDATKP